MWIQQNIHACLWNCIIPIISEWQAHHCKFSNWDKIKYPLQWAPQNCTSPHSTQTLIQGLCPNNQNSRIFSCNWQYSTGVLKILGWTCPFNNFQNCNWTTRLVFKETTDTCLAALKAKHKAYIPFTFIDKSFFDVLTY